MLPPPKKVWNRFASKVISKLGRFLGRLGTTNPSGRQCCRCSCHFVAAGYQKTDIWLQVHRSFWNNNNNNHVQVEDADHQGGDENGNEDLEFVEDLGAMEDQAVDERAEEFIAKFHQSLKLERLQHL